MTRTVQLRRVGKNGETRVLSVPADIARLVPEQAVFQPELTEEGLLFRFIAKAEDQGSVLLPAWIKGKAV